MHLYGDINYDDIWHREFLYHGSTIVVIYNYLCKSNCGYLEKQLGLLKGIKDTYMVYNQLI